MVSSLVHCGVAGLYFALGTLAAVSNTIYLISNAEVPALGQPGLTPIGQKRAQTCLPALFNPLNVGLIIACDPDSGEDDIQYCQEAVATVTPTATALHLQVDTSWYAHLV
ncbi:hypothetical protein CPB83DRAFT_164820 [Crepidotus variabilis]|uniref:Uncharacterized protein n=1 Tax=Crepidotus variabilis TaxID=179855 RepID=A0A9P6EK24_9AGAR|nr:hypothetical protein CPB83DRAFT_164820 [Crepidotus variabilis]